MRIPVAVGVSSLLTLVSVDVHADAPGKRRVLVADAVANGVDANLAKTITSTLVTRLSSRPSVDALSGAELRKLMSLQADKAACGDDTACVDDLTGALGAPLALFSDVGKLGALTVVNLTLFDVTKNEPLARASAQTEKLEELPQKLDSAIDTLLAQSSTPSTTPSTTRATTSVTTTTTPTTIAQAAPTAPTHPKAEKAPVKSAGSDPEVRAEVKQAIEAHRSELKECGDMARKQHKAGFVRVRSLVSSNGKVMFAHVAATDLSGSGVPKCVIEKVATWSFPSSGAPETLVFPLHFK